jgi:hypothetical protein
MDDGRRDHSSDAPFGAWPRGRGSTSNGVRPEGMRTRPIGIGEQDDPVDLVAVQADDELVNALADGMSVSAPGVGGYDTDDRMVAMLAAWRAEVDEEPIPELIDLDEAVAAVRSSRIRARRRQLAPLAGAAALIVLAVGGVSIGAQAAHPGDTLWGVSKVLYSERAESVEAAADVQTRLGNVREALASGQTAVAAQELEMAESEIGVVREEEGLSELAAEQQRLAVKLRETPPGIPTDPDAPSTAARSDQPPDTGRPPAETTEPDETDPRVQGVPAEPTSPAPSSTTRAPSPPTGTPVGGASGTAVGSADPTPMPGQGMSSGMSSGTAVGTDTPAASGSETTPASTTS